MTPRELAALIRKGAAMRPQGHLTFCFDGKTCAIGSAAHAMNPHLTEDSQIGKAGFHLGMNLCINSKFNITELYCRNDRGDTRESIADWLDTLDVAKPKDAQTFERFMQTALVPVDIEAVKS